MKGEINMDIFIVIGIMIVQSAVANGSWCGAQRQQCGDNGSDLI